VIIMTDSGGLQEEAAALQKPVLVLRDNTERKEGVQAGIAKVVGAKNVTYIVEEAVRLLNNVNGAYDAMSIKTSIYGNGTAAKQIVDVLLNSQVDVDSQVDELVVQVPALTTQSVEAEAGWSWWKEVLLFFDP
jgi:UDP-N-acetylglucosamine 2-epimerase (non-hydrolysing)